MERDHSPQTRRAKGDPGGPSLCRQSEREPWAFEENSQSCWLGPTRVHESAFILHSENCEWYPESQARKTQSFPAPGQLQIWAASQGNCFVLLSVVWTNLPQKIEIKSLRVSVPALKDQRGLPSIWLQNSPSPSPPPPAHSPKGQPPQGIHAKKGPDSQQDGNTKR